MYWLAFKLLASVLHRVYYFYNYNYNLQLHSKRLYDLCLILNNIRGKRDVTKTFSVGENRF
jgi:hypothetical protein